ncbi:Hypothetical protein D9617_1g080970 [Elsinoe fawcettii]|nr:Hypothetical protein D9617_1g080970 [Elsinoe fawcettii]
MPGKRKRSAPSEGSESPPEITITNFGAATNQAGNQVVNGFSHAGPVTNNHFHSHSPSTNIVQPSGTVLERRESCMKALEYETLDSRVHDVAQALKSTCKWILKRPEYRSWRGSGYNDQGNRLMWMKGKPASGKSTMMKFLYEKVRRRKGCVVVPFFFNARGAAVDRTQIGMYRALLYQMMQKKPELQAVLDDVRLSTSENGDPIWQPGLLKSLLSALLERLEDSSVVFFIDALDECDQNQVKAMIDSFHEDLASEGGRASNLSIFFASRHFPYLDIRDSIQLILETQPEHEDDISTYIDDKLPSDWKLGRVSVKPELLRRADGVFLWVVLVLRLLQDEHDEGIIVDPARRLQRLRDIPQDLEELFGRVLSQGKQSDPRLVLCVQWSLFSRRPLTVPEMYWAIRSGVSLESFGPEEVHAMASPVMQKSMERYILSSSKGLLEPTRGKKQVVQFIHETVREYFLHRELDYQGFGARADFECRSHEAIKIGCQNYFLFWQRLVGDHASDTTSQGHLADEHSSAVSVAIQANADLSTAATPRSASPYPDQAQSDDTLVAHPMKVPVWQSYPLLGYTLHFQYHHSNTAQGGNIDQSRSLANFDWSGWANARQYLAGDKRRFRHSSDPLILFAFHDLSHLVRLQLMKTRCLDPPRKSYVTAVRSAIEGASHQSLGVMLELMSTCEHEVTFGGPCRSIDQAETDLAVAALLEQKRQPAYTLRLASVILSARKDVSINAKQWICDAAWAGHVKTFQWLLQQDDLDVNVGAAGVNALSIAGHRGFLSIVELLLERDDLRIQVGNTKNVIRAMSNCSNFDWKGCCEKCIPCAGNASQLLETACDKNDPEILNDVVNLIHAWVVQGKTSYRDIVEYACKQDAAAVIRLLLESSAVKATVWEQEYFQGLWLAAMTELALDSVRALCDIFHDETNALERVCDASGSLQLCVKSGSRKQRSLEILTFLIDRIKPDINAACSEGDTALRSGLEYASWDCVRLILRQPNLANTLSWDVESALCAPWMNWRIRICGGSESMPKDVLEDLLHRAFFKRASDDTERAGRNRTIISLVARKSAEMRSNDATPSQPQDLHLDDPEWSRALIHDVKLRELAFSALACFGNYRMIDSVVDEDRLPDLALAINIQRRDAVCVGYLVKRNDCNVNQHKSGFIPLIEAVGSQFPEIVNLLLSCEDLTFDAMNVDGETALAVAKRLGNDEIVALLEAEQRRRRLQSTDAPML